MVGGEEVASPPAGVQPEPAPCRDDFPAPPPCLSSAQSAGPVLHRPHYPEVSAGRGHAIPTHGRASELLHMESRWRFPYGGACAPHRRRGLWPHALLPPDPDACLCSAQHHLPGSWVLPASCPSLTQTTPHRVATSVFLNLGQILSLSTFNCHQRLLTQQEQSPHLPGFLLLLSLPVAHPDLVLGAPNVDVNFVHASFS